MTLLAVERIKLFTTRSPWWCALAALLITVGFTALIVGNAGDQPVTVATTQFAYQFGLAVILVLAALAVTTEYRFGTIRTTFQAVPNRTSALVAKTVVIAVLALVIGEVASFACWGVSQALQPDAALSLDSSADWLNVAGPGVIYALGAVIAVGVGILVRHSAGAIALLLIYSQVVEGLVQLIPNVGDDIYKWMPFNVSHKFVTGDGIANAGRESSAGAPMSTAELSQWWALGYFAAFAVVVLGIALVVSKRRDA